jgi:hypothetical protein
MSAVERALPESAAVEEAEAAAQAAVTLVARATVLGGRNRKNKQQP